MNKSPIQSGYNAKNIATVDKRFICPICRLIFRDPVQLKCGHRSCQSHLPQEDSTIACPECLEITSTKKVRYDRGHINDMQTVYIECSFCNWSGQLKIYQQHLEQSHNQYRCSYCNGICDSVTMLSQHTQSECPDVPVDCPLESCKKQILRCHLLQHYLGEEHQQILLLFVLQILSTMGEDKGQFTTMDAQIDQQMIDLPATTTTTLGADEYDVQQESLNETVEVLSGGMKALRDELQQISDELSPQSQEVEINDQNLTSLKTSIEEFNASLDAMDANLSFLQQEHVSLQQTLAETQYTSYDGTLLWKITNVREKMVDAQSERQVSIYSPPFYSSPSGYKICARLYLFGDGNARRTHMSLFFVLMRSKNDPLLQFPFRYKVIFCLFDQSGQQKHIVDSFRPDAKSNSFQRPRSLMNIASGIPKFVPLSTIQHPDNAYVREDTMFIKVMVDFGTLPKTVLPYAMSLNPALPTNFRERMIQEEVERQTQMASQQEVISTKQQQPVSSNNKTKK